MQIPSLRMELRCGIEKHNNREETLMNFLCNLSILLVVNAFMMRWPYLLIIQKTEGQSAPFNVLNSYLESKNTFFFFFLFPLQFPKETPSFLITQT